MLKPFKVFWASGYAINSFSNMPLLRFSPELYFNVFVFSEKDAQMCIYDASWDTHFGFCCDIEEETSHKLACKVISFSLMFYWIGFCYRLDVCVLFWLSWNECFWDVLFEEIMNFYEVWSFVIANVVEWLNYLYVICVGLPGVLSVKPDPDYSSAKKDYSPPNVQSGFMSYPQSGSTFLFPLSNTKRWLVRMDKPSIGVVTKAQMVDYYAQILTKVLGK